MGKEVTGFWKKLVSDPRFLGETDFEKGEEINGTISKTTEEEVISERGKAIKTVLHFKEDIKPLVLNVTNAKTIEKLTKKKKVQDWKGFCIQIYYDPAVRFGRETVGGTRVRPFFPKGLENDGNYEPVKCENCGEEITPYGNLNPKQIADYTRENYNKALCSNCATKVKNGQVHKNEYN